MRRIHVRNDPTGWARGSRLLDAQECTLNVPFRKGDLALHGNGTVICERKVAHLFQRVLLSRFREATYECIDQFGAL